MTALVGISADDWLPQYRLEEHDGRMFASEANCIAKCPIPGFGRFWP
jgi:hypothetical protein